MFLSLPLFLTVAITLTGCEPAKDSSTTGNNSKPTALTFGFVLHGGG
jgi:hypothetical protein